MKRFAMLLAALVAFAPCAQTAPPEAAPAPKLILKTGAKPSSKKSIASAPRFQRSGKIGAPIQFAAVPTKLSMWGNSQYGDCVTAEECFAKIADNPNVFISEQTCIQWAAKHGFLNGAMLDEVLDAMHRDGITADDGTVYKDGPKAVVDFHDQAALAAAIYQGRVKIAVAADQIMQSVNTTNGKSGWAATNWQQDNNTDHCVSLCGYGTASHLYEALGKPVPSGVDPNQYGYLMFTWNSIGFVSRDSLLAVTTEAWVRNPTTDGFPKPPEPTPAPVPAPIPAPQPKHTVPIWVFAVGGGVVLVLIGGVVFIGRRSATTK